MRYKVNFHVLLCFLSTLCSTTLALVTTTTMTTTTTITTTSTISQQASSVQSEINSKTNASHDAQIADSTFLTNNYSSNSIRSTLAYQNHKIHLASSNDQSSSALVTNDGNGSTFQTGKFCTSIFFIRKFE